MLKRLAVGGLIVGVGVLWKLVIAPTVAVQAKNSMGMGWNDARPELMAQFTEVLTKEFSSLGLSHSEMSAVTGCCADKAVAFLNTTDCSYHYNETTTSEAEHLKAQEACMTRVGYEDQEGKLALACFKEKLPNDWKLLRTALIESFSEGAKEEGLAALESKKMGECFADRAVALANERKCPLINQQATDPSDIFISMDQCVTDSEAEKLGEECAGL